MDKVIRKYLDGDFCYVPGILEFSCPRLELHLQKDEVCRGSFRITASGKREVKGSVISHQNRMVCENAVFEDKESEIFYTFDSRGMEEGEVLQGQFEIVSNQGEYTLPYVVNIEYFKLTSSMGDIKNLFHFANLAKTSWEEAVRLFYTPEFVGVFRGSDEQYKDIYKMLSMPKTAGNEQNVEEFLLEIRKKQQVEFLIEQSGLVYHDVAGVNAEILEVTRNGWGYTRLEVSAEGDFLTLEKEALTENDFLGNLCKCVFYIDAKALHAGNNYGCIIFKNAYQTLRVPVTVQNGGRRQPGRIRRHKKHLTLQLMQYYMAFRMHKIGADTWMEETARVMDEWNSVDSKSVAGHLFRVQLLLTQERYNEAGWLLERAEPLLPKEQEHREALKCYYLYLNSLLRQDAEYTGQITREIRAVYRSAPGNWRVAWLLLYLEEEFDRSVSRKWVFLEELFYQEIYSPIFYIEALQLVEENPTLLMRLNEFEVQLLWFAARHNLLTEDMIRQVHYLVGRAKQYHKQLYEILEACYQRSGDDETLQAICTLLIRENRTGEKYFPWYSLAVERELRIMRLYEYYMMSLPRDYGEEIPRMVLMYFAYRSNLDYGHNGQLYAYVARHREEQPEMFRTYQTDMERFIRQQLAAGRIDRSLAYLYKNMTTEDIRREFAAEYVKASFTCCIHTHQDDIHAVVVRYSRKKGEEVYPVSEGIAYVPLYGEDYRICLQDKQGNRYAAGRSYQIEKLFVAGSALREAAEYVAGDLNLDLYSCQGSRHYTSVDERNVHRAARVAASEEVEEGYRHEIQLLLMKYYFDQDKELQLELLLQEITPEGLSTAQRSGILRYLVLREQYKKALEWVERYGATGVDPKTVVRLCGRILESGEYREDERFTNAIYYAFSRGKYSEQILEYLVAHFEGSTKQMRDIWKAAHNFEVETYQLEERILLQLLYTEGYVGEGVQIFASYVERTPRTDIALAYLSYLTFEYFVKDKVMEPFVWEQVQRMYVWKETLPFVVKAAWLKFLSEKPSLSEQEKEAVGALAGDLAKQGIYFAFFQKFAGLHASLNPFLDKTILEYRARPDSRVVLHYLVEKQQYEEPKYRTEEMRHMYGGIFVKQFILFFGETLQYYITEESEGKSTLTASGTLVSNEVGRELQDTRYGMLNDIVTAWTLQDYDTVDGLLQEFYETDYLVGRLFRLR